MTQKINEKIRDLRKRSGMTLQQLSDLTGFSKGYLSKIENSDFAPRIQTLRRIAEGFSVDISYFLVDISKGEPKQRDIDIVKKNQRINEEIMESNSGYSYQAILHSFKGKYMNPYLLRVPQGKTQVFTHDSEELMYMLKGKITLTYNGIDYILEEGDSVYFDARKKHSILNESSKEAEFLSIMCDYKRF